MIGEPYSKAHAGHVSILAIVFYILAGLIAVCGTIVLIVGSIAHWSIQQPLQPPVSGTYVIVMTLGCWLTALLFWALGATISHLHATREYAKMAAMTLIENLPRSIPSGDLLGSQQDDGEKSTVLYFTGNVQRTIRQRDRCEISSMAAVLLS
jgi:hypothetical protein